LRPLTLPALRLQILVGQPEESAATTASATTIEAFMRSGDTGVELTPPDADAPAVIGYTSGTTGRAKGALLLHSNLMANITAITTAWRWTPEDRLLLTLPLFHTHGLMVGLHGTLFMGASVVLRRKFDAGDALAALDDDPAISLFFGVPTMYGRLVAEAQQHGVPRRRPRLFVSGSAPLSPHLFTEFEQAFGQRILERYGMTETGMNLTNPYDGERRAGTVGGPFPGQEARIVDVSARSPLPPGEIGEIEVRGPHVFAGYINRPDATAEAFDADGWFKTGDLGWVSEDGYFTITGRARELIISGGYNIYPREVEDVLGAHPAVAEVAVLGAPDADMGEQVVAVVVPKAGEAPPAEDLIAFCRERLASYKKPRRVVFVEALPRNALGKVQKHLLSAQIPAS
jgi:malonyl-CoA/methylmalonyl-CoA synthetase